MIAGVVFVISLIVEVWLAIATVVSAGSYTSFTTDRDTCFILKSMFLFFGILLVVSGLILVF